MNTSGSRCR